MVISRSFHLNGRRRLSTSLFHSLNHFFHFFNIDLKVPSLKYQRAPPLDGKKSTGENFLPVIYAPFCRVQDS
jgi:hypothetical protein